MPSITMSTDVNINGTRYLQGQVYTVDTATQAQLLALQSNYFASEQAIQPPKETTVIVAPSGTNYIADYYTQGLNDHLVINKAIQEAAALPSGGTVVLKAGTYLLSGPVKPLNGTKLQGDGMTSTILKGVGADFTALDNRDGTTAVPLRDIEICDLKIDMDTVAVVAADPIDVKCVFLTCVQRLFIHGVWCYGSPGTGIGTDYLVDAIVDRCLVEKCGKAGVAGTNQRFIGCNGFGIGSGRYQNESWIVSNCIAKNVGNNGFLAENLNSATDSYNAQFVNCTAYACNVGFRITGVSHIVVSNCIAYSNYSHGVWVESDDAGSTTNPKRVILSNILSTHNGAAGQSTGAGFYISDSFTAGNRLKNITIANCVSYYNSNHGIWVKNAQGVIISATRIEGNRNQGVLLEATNATNPVTDISINSCHILNNSNTALGASTDHDAIVILAPTGGGSVNNVVINGNRCYDDQATKTQAFAVNVASSASIQNLVIAANNFIGNKNTDPVFIGSAAGKCLLSENLGVNDTVVRIGSTTVGRTERTILCNNSAAVTITLPDATLTTPHRRVTIKDYKGTSATNNITISTSGAQTIDGAATRVISTNYSGSSFLSDGSNWFTV